MNYWGEYVAFVRGGEKRHAWVMRDPSGGIACHHIRIGGLSVYFTRLQDVEPLLPRALTVNYHYVLGYLMYNISCSRETGLNEVSNLLAGEFHDYRDGKLESGFCWDPLKLSEQARADEQAEAARLLRDTTRMCVRACASRFDGILHSLSGGLDSTIVLSCMNGYVPKGRLVCFNGFSPAVDADERKYAHAAAARFGVDLVELPSSESVNLQQLGELGRTYSPFPAVGDPTLAKAMVALSHERDLEARFTGIGGDEVFFQNGVMPTAVDYAYLHGIRPSVLSIALNDAELREESVWSVLRTVARYGRRSRKWSVRDFALAFERRNLIPDTVRIEARRDRTLWHPLFQQASDLPPNKVSQAYSITAYSARGHMPDIDPESPAFVAPLLSQPLVELALGLPTHVLTGRHDRELARRAFANDLPPEITRRATKSVGGFQLRRIVDQNKAMLREFLLDGALMEIGYLDRTRTEEALADHMTPSGSELMELVDCFEVECWLRSWGVLACRAAA
ncbi:MAG: asparagine synthase C-terminal domain-containing protein [Gammaproteobacteria bacterium]